MAGIAGLLYAAASVYWALGGTWLLDTIGGSLEEQGRARGTGVLLVLWVAAALKTIAAALPLLALRRLTRSSRDRAVWVLAWLTAGTLTLYGLVYAGVGLLVQAGVVHSTNPNDRAMAWHAFVWDPWFLIWGALALAALARGRHHRDQVPKDRGRRALRRALETQGATPPLPAPV